VIPILPASMNASLLRKGRRMNIGKERYVVSMFVDMRGSTKLAEARLPFDVVFLINRFLAAVSQAALDAGGQPNQFIGDGTLALFGQDDAETRMPPGAAAAARVAANVEHEQADEGGPARADPVRHRHPWRRRDCRRHRLQGPPCSRRSATR
jgi:adenylate cyclase